jgi:predicted RNA-binding protein with PUA-like domain
MSAALSTWLKEAGDAAPIVKAARGRWSLRMSDAPAPPAGPQHWFLVTNPAIYDAEELFRHEREVWGERIESALVKRTIRDHVRQGDRAFVYRSRPHADVLCEVEVAVGPYLKADRYVFEVKALRKLDPPVSLAQLRAHPQLQDMPFLLNSRVSISPLTPEQYAAIGSLLGSTHEAGDEHSHDMVQWQLLRLGRALGCDVWASTDARGREHEGERFSSLCIDQLPVLGFSDATIGLIRNIDVLWLRGSSIVAAFEIEHTTSIYSGLLRMSDLVVLQPNIAIDLYIVAPSARRDQVFRQLRRPTFDRLPRPLRQIVRFIPYDPLAKLLSWAEEGKGYVQAEVIRTYAEECEG